MAIDEYIPTEYINDSIPAINASNLNKAENAIKTVTDEVRLIGSVAPVGSVIAFAGSPAPQGYLTCDGSEYSRSAYPSLFSAISTLYGSGNGSTTFNVPDLRGEFVRGLDDGRGVDPGRVLGTNQEFALERLQATITFRGEANRVGFISDTDGIAEHSSTESYDAESGEDGNSLGRVLTLDSALTTNSADETRPRNVAMTYIIKT